MRLKIYILLTLFILVSCNQKEVKSQVEVTKKNDVILPQDFKNVSLDIGGMTCEIGCAKLIESKLSKIEGVKMASVIFKDSIGKVTFDANKISKDEIVSSIEKIADGELYTVKKVTETE